MRTVIISLTIAFCLSVGCAAAQNISDEAVRTGVDVNTKDSMGRTSLIRAAHSGNVTAVEMLLAKGADVNAKDNVGKTALLFAADEGDAEIVKALLAKGADVNVSYYNGITVLMRAVYHENVAIAKALLAEGVDVNAKDHDGETALMRAVMWGYTETVEVLLVNGADVNAKENTRGETALMQAANKGCIDTMKALLAEGADVSIKDGIGRTALMFASGKEQAKIVNVLLTKGADVNATNNFGYTALMKAANEGRVDTVEALLTKGANVNAKNELGYTALSEAAARGRTETVEALLAKGADVNAKDNMGRTALSDAAWCGRIETVEALLAKGADVNAKDNRGRTALMYAREEGHASVVEVLLAKASGSNNKSAVDIKENVNSEAAKSKNSAEREWLVLVYMSGVNDLGILGYANGSINALESVKLTNTISVVVKCNGISDKSNLLGIQSESVELHIQHDSDTNRISSTSFRSGYNWDMGDYKHLSRFAISNILRFPAEKIILIIWGHGAGCRGIAHDDVSHNHIRVNQLGLALSDITKTTGRNLDIFATDASFMQMASVAWELKDYTKVIIGSEESVPGQGYPYKSILTKLNNNPGIDAQGFANMIVTDYGDYYSADKGITVSAVRNCGNHNYSGGTTISAVDTVLMPQFVKLLNNWVISITSNDDDLKKVAKLSVSENVFNFGSFDVEKGARSIDICDFIDLVDKVLSDESKAKEEGKILRDFITGNLILSHRGTGTKKGTTCSYDTRTCGLAIYMPKLIYASDYNELIFSRDSLWDDFVGDILTEILTGLVSQ